ncbi:MAG: hypothetical protein ACERKJ_10980 [Candidatus Dadabacteria bacterium]
MHEIIKDIFTTYAGHYKKEGDYSATELINPPRVTILNNKYPECSKRISMMGNAASLVGTGVHKYIEGLLTPYSDKYKLEHRLFVDVLNRKLSGAFDILKDNKDIFDIKTCLQKFLKIFLHI